MRRSRKRSRNPGQKKIIIFFLLGISVGLIFSIFYRTYKPAIVTLYTVEKKPAARHIKALPEPEAARFKVAIVLDDFGYNYNNVKAIFNLKRPVTFSILPFHPYSKIVARQVYQKGYEAILHLPLEPYENGKYIRPETDTIRVDMKKNEAVDKLTKALKDVPYAKGVSNHQGSKATEDTALMQTIFAELKKRNLFFLDSLVTKKSVCKKAAGCVGIRFGQRNIFLDNEEDFEYIKGQMQQLVTRAKKYGSAIGIGHDRTKTILALSKLMPEAEKEGIEFVFLSELIK